MMCVGLHHVRKTLRGNRKHHVRKDHVRTHKACAAAVFASLFFAQGPISTIS